MELTQVKSGQREKKKRSTRKKERRKETIGKDLGFMKQSPVKWRQVIDWFDRQHLMTINQTASPGQKKTSLAQTLAGGDLAGVKSYWETIRDVTDKNPDAAFDGGVIGG